MTGVPGITTSAEQRFAHGTDMANVPCALPSRTVERTKGRWNPYSWCQNCAVACPVGSPRTETSKVTVGWVSTGGSGPVLPVFESSSIAGTSSPQTITRTAGSAFQVTLPFALAMAAR
ncbi:MAG: hypothetical protein BWY76_01951 [bacterium ADurb.Bin429]|nr:MAG: hypothetical protein BWY76_01951 [bacterium ADurb.Bin429]